MSTQKHDNETPPELLEFLRGIFGPNVVVKRMDRLPTPKELLASLPEHDAKVRHGAAKDEGLPFHTAVIAMMQGKHVRAPGFVEGWTMAMRDNKIGLYFYGKLDPSEEVVHLEELNRGGFVVLDKPPTHPTQVMDDALRAAFISTTGAHGYDAKIGAFVKKLDELGYMVAEQP